MTTIHLNAVVGPDGALDLHVSELPPGERVTITVESEVESDPATAQPSPERPHMIDLIKNLPGHRLFTTAEEVDNYLRQERDAWDR